MRPVEPISQSRSQRDMSRSLRGGLLGNSVALRSDHAGRVVTMDLLDLPLQPRLQLLYSRLLLMDDPLNFAVVLE